MHIAIFLLVIVSLHHVINLLEDVLEAEFLGMDDQDDVVDELATALSCRSLLLQECQELGCICMKLTIHPESLRHLSQRCNAQS